MPSIAVSSRRSRWLALVVLCTGMLMINSALTDGFHLSFGVGATLMLVAIVVQVTAAGRRKVAQADAIVASVNADVLSSLPSLERQAFARALRRLVDKRLSVPKPCEPAVRRPRAARGS